MLCAILAKNLPDNQHAAPAHSRIPHLVLRPQGGERWERWERLERFDPLLWEISVRGDTQCSRSTVNRLERLPYLCDFAEILFDGEETRAELAQRSLERGDPLGNGCVLLNDVSESATNKGQRSGRTSHECSCSFGSRLTSVAPLISPDVCHIARPTSSTLIPSPASFCCLIHPLCRVS
jgi:hypothetical protein